MPQRLNLTEWASAAAWASTHARLKDEIAFAGPWEGISDEMKRAYQFVTQAGEVARVDYAKLGNSWAGISAEISKSWAGVDFLKMGAMDSIGKSLLESKILAAASSPIGLTDLGRVFEPPLADIGAALRFMQEQEQQSQRLEQAMRQAMGILRAPERPSSPPTRAEPVPRPARVERVQQSHPDAKAMLTEIMKEGRVPLPDAIEILMLHPDGEGMQEVLEVGMYYDTHKGRKTQEACARDLGMSLATFKRRLREYRPLRKSKHI